MNTAVEIQLTPEEENILKKTIRSRKAPIRLIERSKIIWMASEGHSNIEIAEQLKITAHKVGRWRNRYAVHGYDGIKRELPRGNNQGGRKSADQARLRSKIIKMTTQSKPKDATHWSTRTLAKELGTTHSFVNRVWQESGLKPHLLMGFKVSNDPRFEEKLEDVVGLYLSPPENAVVFCVDEKSSIQALAAPRRASAHCRSRLLDHLIRTLNFLGAGSRQFYHLLRNAFRDQFIGMIFTHPLAVGLFVEAEIAGRVAEDIYIVPRSALQANKDWRRDLPKVWIGWNGSN